MRHLILTISMLAALPAFADPLLFWSSGRPGGGNDVLPLIVKRPVNNGCGRVGSVTCTPTKPTGGK